MANVVSTISVKGRNVETMSSILDFNTLNADVSGFTYPPIDGEWLFFNGNGKAASHAAAELTIDGTNFGYGATLAMIWSEKGRSDIQSLGNKRVPVIFRKSVHCMLHLYNYNDAALPAAGCLITVALATQAVDGDVGPTRLIADVTDATVASGQTVWAAGSRWVVGYVIGGPGAKTTTGGGGVAGGALEVYLYDSPRMVTTHV